MHSRLNHFFLLLVMFHVLLQVKFLSIISLYLGRKHAQVEVFFQFFCCSISGEHFFEERRYIEH